MHIVDLLINGSLKKVGLYLEEDEGIFEHAELIDRGSIEPANMWFKVGKLGQNWKKT